MHGQGLQLALVFLLAAVIAVPLFKRFGLGAVLGYLAAGVALGPFGLKFIKEAGPVLTASEIGVVMMLFVIGLELSPSRLWVMRKPVFGLGGLQVLLSGVALGALAMLVGLGWKAALVVGLGLALSSTAVSLQLLSERKALNSPHGRSGFAILLFQDLAAIPLIAAIPVLGVAANTEGSVWQDVAKAVGAVIAVVILGRVVLRHLFRLAARIGVPEMLTASALFAVLGAAWVMSLAGLSMGLGAFLAGVLLADSEFRHEIESQVEPFKGLLLGLFFMAVGMSIDLDAIAHEPATILVGTVALLLVKSMVLFALGVWPARIGWREGLSMAAVLALGGEFAFVVLAESVKARLIDATLQNQLVAMVGLSMALTPLSVIAVSRWLKGHPMKAPPREYDAIPDHQPLVILAGFGRFGRFGQIVARMLVAQKIPFIALETDAEQLEVMRRFGNRVYFGDPARPDLLRAAGAAGARVFINAIDSPEANLRTTRVVRRLYPHLRVFARAHDRRHAWQLMDLGAEVTRETFASGLEMGRDVLMALGMSREQAEDRARKFRAHDEQLLATQHLIYDDEVALLESANRARSELEQLFQADVGDDGTRDDAMTEPAPPQG